MRFTDISEFGSENVDIFADAGGLRLGSNCFESSWARLSIYVAVAETAEASRERVLSGKESSNIGDGLKSITSISHRSLKQRELASYFGPSIPSLGRNVRA